MRQYMELDTKEVDMILGLNSNGIPIYVFISIFSSLV